MAEARFAVVLYVRLVAMALRSQLQYRRGFALQLLAYLVLTFSEFGALLVLFGRFPSMAGWHVGEVAVLYGLSSMSFSLGEMLGDGFNTCTALVRRGDFDRVLLRPASAFVQMLAADLLLRRLGRFVQGAIALFIGLARVHPAPDLAHLAVIVPAIISGTLVYLALFVLQATLSFWTTEGIEVANIVTNGGQVLASYPLPVFPGAMRAFFTFIIPLAFVGYVPATYLLGRRDPLGLPSAAPWLAPVVAVLFLLIATRIWSFGVRHYRSTGT